MIGYWSFVKGCRLERILSNQRPRLPSITSLSRFFPSPVFPRERLVARQFSSQKHLCKTIHLCTTFFCPMRLAFPRILRLQTTNVATNYHRYALAGTKHYQKIGWRHLYCNQSVDYTYIFLTNVLAGTDYFVRQTHIPLRLSLPLMIHSSILWVRRRQNYHLKKRFIGLN